MYATGRKKNYDSQKNDWTGVTIIAIEGRVRIEVLGMIRHDMMARVAVQ